ncbi:helix-turn-helix transcriptional regulator [Candidatus Deferrimicrobium sp.]|uniref:helix-turn-helix transcriptional regulator n=1 Tax=Candidatus Deferrimicrobium sp. TaxID=3060586 RepID=UPI00351D9801
MTPPLLRPQQVADTLGISAAMVYQLARTGQLAATTFSAWPVKEGGKRRGKYTGTVRFTEQSVQAFIAEHTGERRAG